MTYSVRKAEGGGWDIVLTEGYKRTPIRHFEFRQQAREWLKKWKANNYEPVQDTSIWRNAATPIADNH